MPASTCGPRASRVSMSPIALTAMTRARALGGKGYALQGVANFCDTNNEPIATVRSTAANLTVVLSRVGCANQIPTAARTKKANASELVKAQRAAATHATS